MIKQIVMIMMIPMKFQIIDFVEAFHTQYHTILVTEFLPGDFGDFGDFRDFCDLLIRDQRSKYEFTPISKDLTQIYYIYILQR